jgi:hypothetical protein
MTPGISKAMPGVWVACPVNAACVDGAHFVLTEYVQAF